jgi:hypothetical protein
MTTSIDDSQRIAVKIADGAANRFRDRSFRSEINRAQSNAGVVLPIFSQMIGIFG